MGCSAQCRSSQSFVGVLGANLGLHCAHCDTDWKHDFTIVFKSYYRGTAQLVISLREAFTVHGSVQFSCLVARTVADLRARNEQYEHTLLGYLDPYRPVMFPRKTLSVCSGGRSQMTGVQECVISIRIQANANSVRRVGWPSLEVRFCNIE